MASVTAKKSKGPVIDPALCRCCHSIKRCRLLTSEYEFMGSKEVYSDMFMDVFGLLLSHLDGHDTECCICATCVSRLREASEFRRQVLQSEQMFLQARLTDDDKQMKLEVKEEPVCDSEPRDEDPAAADHHDDTEMDSQRNKPPAVSDENNTKEKSSRRSRNGHKAKARDLRAGKVQRLHRKLDKLLKPETPAVESHTKKRAEAMDRHRMALSNTVAIVTHSYACPFHNRISFYYCFYCRDQFTDPAELRAHTLTHDPKLFESSIENKKIPKIDITRIDCRLCTDTIDDLDAFKTHVTERHRVVLYPVENEFLKFRLTLNKLACTECDAVFPYFDSLKKHMIEHFGTHTCDVCGACFLEPASLRTHLKTHTKVDANYPCSVCGKNLKSKYSMGLHVATVHEKKPTVNCYKCDAAFLSYALRNRHLIEAHGDARTFPCDLCDKVYNRRKTLIEHHRRNHLKVFNHRCELCDQRFYLPSRLREHMATHTGERGFRCELCDKTYPRLQALHEHARCHADDTLRSAPKTHAKTAHGAFRSDADFSH